MKNVSPFSENLANKSQVTIAHSDGLEPQEKMALKNPDKIASPENIKTGKL